VLKWFPTAILAAALVLTAMTTADAKRAHRSKQTTIIDCNDRGCSERVVEKKHRKTRKGRAAKRIKSDTHQTFSGWGGDYISRARAYLGQTARQVGVTQYGNGRPRRSLWCSAFLRKVIGERDGVDDRARSWLNRPRTTARAGVVAVVRSRRNHVGIVTGVDANGNIVLVSGNSTGRRVTEQVYPRSSVIAFVEP
jgi:hypothetical protein